MALKNFVFRENWVASEVASMETAFLPYLTQLGPIFWPQKAQILNSLNRILIFNIFRKTKAMLLPSMWLKDWLTKVTN